MGPRTDVEFERARAGDPRAFRRLIEELAPALTRFVTFFLHGDVHAANDVVQDTFVEAWRRIGTMTSSSHLRPWLYHVAKCRAVSWLRRRAPPGARIETLDTVRESAQEIASRARPLRASDGPFRKSTGVRARLPEACADAPDLADALRRALLDLPRAYAAVVELHYLHGYDTRETARLLNVTRTTVKMRLHRARKALRREIEERVARRGGGRGRPGGPR